MANRWHVTAALLSMLVVGCGGGEEVVEKQHDPVDQSSHASTPNTTSESVGNLTLNSEEKPEESKKPTDFVPVFADKGARDPFAPPTVMPDVPEPEPELEPVPILPQKSRPPMTLVGFVNVDHARAMLKLEDELVLVGVGDIVSGVEIVAVSSPALTLKFGDEQYAMNLFDRASSNSRKSTGSAVSVKRAGVKGSTAPIPQLSLPALPLNGAGRGIPGLPGAGAGRSIPKFPKIQEST